MYILKLEDLVFSVLLVHTDLRKIWIVFWGLDYLSFTFYQHSI